MGDSNKAYARQEKLALWGFLMELPGFVLVTLAATATSSLIVITDFIDSFCNVLNEGFAMAMSYKLKKDLTYDYNYGKGKIEAIATLFCDSLLLLGLCIVVFGAVREIISPKEPSALLGWVVLLKIGNVACDGLYCAQEKRLIRQNGGALIETEYVHSVRALFFDAFALVSLLLCYLLRAYPLSWYIAPACSIVLAATFLTGAVRRICRSVMVLTDRTLPEKQQLLILKELNTMYDRYEELVAVNSRLVGETAVIEVRLRFADDATYEQMAAFKEELSEKIRGQIPGAEIILSLG